MERITSEQAREMLRVAKYKLMLIEQVYKNISDAILLHCHTEITVHITPLNMDFVCERLEDDGYTVVRGSTPNLITIKWGENDE